MKIIFTDAEMKTIQQHGETCIAVALAAMECSKLSFDDIEEINQHYEIHRWGSDADRRYRKAAINKAARKIAANPLQYI